MKFMKSFFAKICILGLIGMTLGVAVKAADTASVVATVTVQNISVSVYDGNVAYGIMAVNNWKSTLPGDLNDMQTVTNDGNVTEDFNIKGQNSTNWTLVETPGNNEYTHQFCETGSNCANPPTNYTALTTNYATLKTNVPASGTAQFHLRLGTPTATTHYTEQRVDVTIQAVAS